MPVDWHPVNFTPANLSPPVRLDLLATRLNRALRPFLPLSGRRVALAVGSRGIAHLPEIIRMAVDTFRSAGADVCLVPAMGSHGGGTLDGQVSLLRELGISEQTTGASIRSAAEIICLGFTDSGIPVWSDAVINHIDWLVPINRVKPHTAFQGPRESGPSKMLAVGMGRSLSAETCHKHGLEIAVPEVADFWLRSEKVPLAIAVVENCQRQLTHIEIFQQDSWPQTEQTLLREARALAPRLPWPEIDLLVVERIGKNISGTGMDLQVIGLHRRFPENQTAPKVYKVVALSLTPESRGNANGVGYADVVTRALATAIDWEVTYANCRTTGFLDAAKLPYVAADEEQAIEVALRSLPARNQQSIRAVRIADTGNLQHLQISPVLLQDLPSGVHRGCG